MNKTILILILMWLCALTAHSQTVEVYNIAGKQDDATWKNQAVRVLFYDNFRDNWLCVARKDYTPSSLKGFNYGYTYISSRFKPVVTEFPNHTWIITFVVELETF